MLSSPIIPYHVGIEEFSTPSETTRTRFSKVIIWQIPLYYGIDLTLTNKVAERSSTSSRLSGLAAGGNRNHI